MNCLKCEYDIKPSDEYCSKCGNHLLKEKEILKIYQMAKDNVLIFCRDFPFLNSTINEKETIIRKIVADTCSAGNDSFVLKLFLYSGFFIRRAEGSYFRKRINFTDIGSNILEVIKANDGLKDEIEGLANYLDESSTLGFSSNIKPFLYLKEDELYIIFNDIIDDLYKTPMVSLYATDEEGAEVLNRNATFGYCLAVSSEINMTVN